MYEQLIELKRVTFPSIRIVVKSMFIFSLYIVLFSIELKFSIQLMWY